MTNRSISRQSLLASFSNLSEQFTSSLKEAQALEREFKEARKNFIKGIDEDLKHAQQSLPQSNPLQHLLLSFADTLKKTNSQWNEKAAGQKKGVCFRKGYEKSLLVFVNGKVKSGKSSLGNFMAWGHTDPTPSMKANIPVDLQPVYHSGEQKEVEGGDAKQEAEKNREFRVGATEATSSIQSFTLPGLTWVDSPGLHSLKQENETLAREYRDHADLILYTMKSDAPGRESDVQEIKELAESGKKMLLLITGSDDTEEDVDANGNIVQTIVMKDAERRNKQHEYVRNEALKNLPGIEKMEIVSISARYAQENMDNPEALHDSGMAHFFSTLQQICHSEGIKLKQRVPMQNLHNFLGQCQSNLGIYAKLIDEFDEKTQKIKEQTANNLTSQKIKGQQKLSDYINACFDKVEPHRNDAEKVKKRLQEFQSEVLEKIDEIAQETISNIAADLSNNFNTSIKDTLKNSALSKIPDFSIDTITEEIAVDVQSGTKKRNSVFGAMLGGAIGGLLGGPAGAAVGASIGAGLGSASGRDASTDYRDVEIIAGDNLHEIRRSALSTCRALLEKTMDQRIAELIKDFESTVEQLPKGISNHISQFENQLKNISEKTQSYL